jgi:succinoglycan biosynthesis transport protein ExoP
MEALTGKRIRPLTRLSQDWAGTESDSSRRSAAPGDGMQSLTQVVESIRKYKRFIIRVIGAGVLLITAASLSMSPSYMASVQLLVDPRTPGPADSSGGGNAASAPPSEDAVIDTHVTMLQSDSYLRRLVPALRAIDEEEHSLDVSPPTLLHHVRTKVHTAWTNAKAGIFGPKPRQTDGAILAWLRNRLKVAQERRSRIISITFTAADPKRAADTANTVARSYVDELARQKQAVETQALNAITMQSSAIQRELSNAKEELQVSGTDPTAQSKRAALEWRVTTLAQQYEMLLRRRQDLSSKTVGVQPEVVMLGSATPPDQPSSLNALFIIPPAAITLALLACLLAVILDRFDRTLRTESEAMQALHIPCAGSTPLISLEPSQQPQHLLTRPAVSYTKAVRSVLVSIFGCDPLATQTQRLVLITSSVRGEGKTTLAWSLGLYAAQLGQRALLLDFSPTSDRRAPDGHDLFSILAQDRSPTARLEAIQRHGIDYLPAGLCEGGGLRVLTHPKLPALLEQLTSSYDLVIVDSPSMQEAPEGTLLAQWADHVLIAIRSGSTDRETAQVTVTRLARAERLNGDTKLWSVLTYAHPSPDDAPGMDAPAELTLLPRLKSAVDRWVRPGRKSPLPAPHDPVRDRASEYQRSRRA